MSECELWYIVRNIYILYMHLTGYGIVLIFMLLHRSRNTCRDSLTVLYKLFYTHYGQLKQDGQRKKKNWQRGFAMLITSLLLATRWSGVSGVSPWRLHVKSTHTQHMENVYAYRMPNLAQWWTSE